MCDTMVATPPVTAGGVMIVGKNSDREPNEAQNVTFVPAMDHAHGDMVKCTYIDVPQVPHTYAALLSRPFWMFGAEMGVNEHGVAIGNEAVFTREKYIKQGVLTGMDLLRLALERSATAQEALEIITSLIRDYGQGGNCAMNGSLVYHNSFIIADPENAWILETAGIHWAALRVKDLHSISNCLTIGEEFDLTSPGLEAYAAAKGYMKRGRKLDFARDFSDTLFTHFAGGRVRRSCSRGLLAEHAGSINSAKMMDVLRDHNGPEPFRPGKAPMKRVCMHAGGLISSQSTGSMVAVLKKGYAPLVYMTGTAAPCLGLFKPHILAPGQAEYRGNRFTAQSPFGGLDLYGSADSRYNPDTLWWRGEEMHRRVLMNYPVRAPEWQEQRDRIEQKMMEQVESSWMKQKGGPGEDFPAGIVDELIEENLSGVDRVSGEYPNSAKGADAPLWFRAQWKYYCRKAGMLTCS